MNFNSNTPPPFLSSSPHGEHHEDSHGVHYKLVIYFSFYIPSFLTSSPHGEHHEKSHGVHEELRQEFLFPYRIAKIGII